MAEGEGFNNRFERMEDRKRTDAARNARMKADLTEELKKINEIRKAQGRRPLTIDEYAAMKTKPTTAHVPKTEVFASDKKRPVVDSATYMERLSEFNKMLEVASELDIISRASSIVFHTMSARELQEIVRAAVKRDLLLFLTKLQYMIMIEDDKYALMREERERMTPIKHLIGETIAALIVARERREAEAAEAAAAAAAAVKEAEAAAVAAAAAKNAEEAAAAVAKKAAQASDPYRQLIVAYTEAQEKAGRANVAAKGRAIRLRAALEQYNRSGAPIPEDLLSGKIKKELKEKALMKGGRRQTRKHRK
jgi:hypothetical protein